MRRTVSFPIIAFVVDRDSDKELMEWTEKLNDRIAQLQSFHTEQGTALCIRPNRGWAEAKMEISFRKQKKVWFLVQSLPMSEDGAIETFCMNMLQEKHEFLVEEARNFVSFLLREENSSRLGKCLATRREKIKAPLAVFFAVYTPERTFNETKQILTSIPWEEYEGLRKFVHVFKKFQNE